MIGLGSFVSRLGARVRPLAWAAAVAVSGCYSPDYDVTGKYEIRWTTVATSTLSWPESTKCDGPGGPRSTISEIEIAQDPNYAIIVHFGCKVPVRRRGSVLQTGGFEKCELVPGSQAEALGWKERYYDIRLDLTSGEMYLATRNLGENASGSCHVMDAHVRHPGRQGPKRGSKFWFYEGTGGALAERYRDIWQPNGYIEERADGTLYVQGFGCTLPGRTPPGETAEVPDGACRTGVFAEYGAPELAAQRYSFNDTEFSMSGEYHGVDRDYTFEIQSTSLRPDDWDSRHE
jgi:hypothetical protein